MGANNNQPPISRTLTHLKCACCPAPAQIGIRYCSPGQVRRRSFQQRNWCHRCYRAVMTALVKAGTVDVRHIWTCPMKAA